MRNLTPLARRVVDAPELLHLISDFASRKDRVNLLCVSRRAFACAAASLWEDLQDITVLLKLFPGVTITKEGESSDRQHLTINFPSTIDPSRFKVYSPFVKQLEIISDPQEIVIKFGENASTFYAFAQKATLVPNLTKLAITTLEVGAEEYDRWVTTFLSPALVDIELIYYGAHTRFGLDSTLVPDFLERISTNCPKLRRLEIFPREDADNYEFEWDSDTKSTKADLKRSKMLASLNTQLSSFRALRALKSSVLVLRPAILSTLGELPALEALSINGDCREPRIVDLVIPDSAFPSLHTLELENFHTANLRYISELSPLLRRLKKIAMTVAYDDNLWHYGWEDDGESNWPFKLIQSVAKNAPLLTDLSVDFSTDECAACFSSDWLGCLRDLSLKRLDLRNVEIECRWSEFASALPTLEEFRTLHLGRGTISQLAKLLPRLQLLELDSINVRAFGAHEGAGGDEDEDDDGADEEEDGEEEEEEEEEDDEGESDEDHKGERKEGVSSKESKAAHIMNDKAVSKPKPQLLRLKAAYKSNSKTPIGDQELNKIAR
ncbi:hypothetical protein BDV93DRAFT_555217 [Ceratobasidium sp. AG-I]|nr:hypothetical protein BDV93DRAFT_555217 [Ceratobasidium sp. AG-I]